MENGSRHRKNRKGIFALTGSRAIRFMYMSPAIWFGLTLDILQKMQDEKPRFNRRLYLRTLWLARQSKIRRIKALKQVSANVYYLHELSRQLQNRASATSVLAKWRAGSCFAARVSIPPCIPISPWLLQSHSTACGWR